MNPNDILMAEETEHETQIMLTRAAKNISMIGKINMKVVSDLEKEIIDLKQEIIVLKTPVKVPKKETPNSKIPVSKPAKE